MIDLRQELSQLEQRSSSLLSGQETDVEFLVDRLREELSNSIEELHAADDMLRSQRRNAQELLAEPASSEISPLLLDFAGLAFLETNRSGTILRTNDALAERLGRRARFLVGKPVAVLVHDEDRAALRTALDHAFNETASTLPLRLKRQDKSVWAAEVTAVCLGPQTNVAVQWLFLDSTEQANAARSINEAFHAELEALASITAVSAENEDTSMQSLLDHTAGVAHIVVDADWTTIQLGSHHHIDRLPGLGQPWWHDFECC